MKGPKPYGHVLVGARPIPRVPDADRILGGLLEFDIHGKPDAFALHYESTEGPRELRMDFGNLMFLLSIAKAVQLDCGIPFPDDPRAPSGRNP